MRESIGTTWVLQLVILFILLFVGFLTLSLNYSKSYKVKNELLSVIEKYEGLTTDSVKIINNYLSKNGYKTMGKCGDDGWYGTKSIDSDNGVLERTNLAGMFSPLKADMFSNCFSVFQIAHCIRLLTLKNRLLCKEHFIIPGSCYLF